MRCWSLLFLFVHWSGSSSSINALVVSSFLWVKGLEKVSWPQWYHTTYLAVPTIIYTFLDPGSCDCCETHRCKWWSLLTKNTLFVRSPCTSYENGIAIGNRTVCHADWLLQASPHSLLHKKKQVLEDWRMKTVSSQIYTAKEIHSWRSAAPARDAKHRVELFAWKKAAVWPCDRQLFSSRQEC